MTLDPTKTPPLVTHEERQHEAAYGQRFSENREAYGENGPRFQIPGEVVDIYVECYKKMVSEFIKEVRAAEVEPALPADPAARKAIPLVSGLLDYFPAALMAVAAVSKIATDQHHPGEPMHWDRSKSPDEADCLLRHLVDRGTVDTDGVRHSAKVAWRALALLQKELEAAGEAPLSRASL